MELAAYIKSLDDFTLIEDGRPPGQPEYEHMGALLTDAILQAGQTYETVVRPRALRVMSEYPDADTTSAFLSLLKGPGYQEVLKWRDPVKPDRLMRLAEFLQKHGIETVGDLQTWVKRPTSRKELLGISGVGPKTADYLAWLSGVPTVAVDRHIKRFCAAAGIKTRDIKEAVRQASEELGVDEGSLDFSIWLFESQKGKKG